MERPVEVVVSELHLAANRLREAGQRLQDGLSSVDLETRELLGSGWKGDAASAYSTAWDQWHHGAGQVVRGVQTMSDLLRVAGDQYDRTDEQAAGAVASSFPASGAGDGQGTPAGSPATGATAQPSTGAASGPSGSSDALSSSVGQVGQVGGQVASGLAQAGQKAGAMVTQAAQAAAGVAQQVGQTIEQAVEKAAETAKDAKGPEDHDGAAPGDHSPTGAPVEPPADSQTPGREVPQ
jgi:WXG100 family type VII secretion target